MSEHNHAEYVDGCFRCDLSGDEVEPDWGCTEDCPDDCMADHRGETS